MIQFIEKQYIKILIMIPIISLLMHLHIFKLDLIGIHVWRQTQTQTVINNFYSEDCSILSPKFNDKADPDRIVSMEFPIMQWLFAMSYKIFGSDVMISRILTFIIGLFSVLGIFYLLLNIFNNKLIAVIGAWCFNFSPEFYYYTVNPLPDNFALCFAIWSMALFFKWLKNKNKLVLVCSAFCLSIATLSKLPFILYLSVIGTYIILELQGNFRTNIKRSVIIITIFIVIILPAIFWYARVIPTWKGNDIVSGILDLQINFKEIFYILQHNLISTLPELLINYAAFPFFLAGFYFIFKNKIYTKRNFIIFLIWSILVLLYFIFEINVIKTKHDYYLFPFLPIIFIIVAYGVWKTLLLKKRIFRYLTIFLMLVLPFTAFLRANPRWDTTSPGFNVDFYNNKTELRSLVKTDDLIIIGNDYSHFILLYYVDKKGWTFDDYSTSQQFNKWISLGAKYLFTDAQIDTISDIKRHLGEKIYDKGTIRVYKLNKIKE